MSKIDSSKFPFAIWLFALALPVFSIDPPLALASTTDGTIDATNRYAWSEAGSWLDFGTAEGNVHVTDTALTGYAWSSELGWISLNCSNDSSCATVDYKVANDAEGNLSGHAWGETAGWIDFDPTGSGVTINSSGEFSGYAWSDQIGWISFNCSNDSSCATVSYKVATDWRPASARPSASSVENTVRSSSGSRVRNWQALFGAAQTPTPVPTAPKVSKLAPSDSTASVLDALVPDFLKRDTKQAGETLEQTVSVETPPTFRGKWGLLPTRGVEAFVLAPLPRELAILAEKFPRLAETFDRVGVTKMSDLDRLQNARLTLPGISERAGISGSAVPLSSLTDKQKDRLPSGVIFAKSGSLIDYDISLSITDEGVPEQKISTIAGKPLDLAVKADRPVNKITGYLTVKNIERESARRSIPASSLLAAPIIAVLGVSRPADAEIEIEQKLVLDEFEYADLDGDGIWTARITAPMVRGEYEVISVLEYKSVTLGKKELRLTTVVDPEGYIYEENGGKETRVPEAKVSLLVKEDKGEFALWPAKDYQQTNPQKTDKSGTYSFLVPPGEYKLTVTADGYFDFDGVEFTVTAGRGVHENIKLKPKSWWRTLFGLFK